MGVLTATHRGTSRCPGRIAPGTKRQPLSAALLHCCCAAEPVLTRATKHTPSVKHACRGVLAYFDSTYDSLCQLHAVHDFLMYSASPATTMITFSSSSLFFSSSSPRSDPSFIVDSSFLPPNSMGMTVTGLSMWDRNVGDLFNVALGYAFLWNQLSHLSNFVPNLLNWHNNILLNNVFGISSVHVTRSSLPPCQILLVIPSRSAQQCGHLVDHHLLHNLTIELCDFLLVVTFARDDPTRLVLHGTSDVDRTLLLLEFSSLLLEDSSASSHCP